ncbi:MAG TPA: HNH endonuclease [Ktedonobacterales bacterium]|nr:HNH endonuclease [Ktedonobacterales bacterium]
MGTVKWQAAVCLAVLDKVDVLEEYDVDCNSPSTKLKVPAVLRARTQFKMHKDGVNFSRNNVLARDGRRCCYCGKRKHPRDLNYDHVVPRIQGGRTVWENIVTSCYGCNSRKGGRTPQQAGMVMHYQPYRPASLTATQPLLLDLDNIPEQWRPYLTAISLTA